MTTLRGNLLCDLNHAKKLFETLTESEWRLSVDAKPKLRTYKLFKQNYFTEHYVLNHLSKYERSLISQLRFGILPLRLETGRYRNITDNTTGKLRNLKPEERVCEICETNNIENEYHFLCICPKYAKERSIMYNSLSKKYPEFNFLTNDDKFYYILNNANKVLGSFLTKSWEIRKSSLYQ